MSWSYSGDPTSSPMDALRFEVGDTDINNPMLQNEELSYMLGQSQTILHAAVYACEVLSRKFAVLADMRIGPTSISASQRAEAFAKRAMELRKRIASSHAPTFNPDIILTPPAFKRRLMDNKQGCG